MQVEMMMEEPEREIEPYNEETDDEVCECGHKRFDHHFCELGPECEGHGECECCNQCEMFRAANGGED